MDTHAQRTAKRKKSMWVNMTNKIVNMKKFKSRLLTILSMTLGCLLGGDSAIDRPTAKVKIKGSSTEEKFLYDSGAQISLLSKKAFRKIAKNKRPEKINFKLTCSGVSGSQLKVIGCYNFKFKLLGREIEHPFFVVEKIPGQSGVIGIDIIKKHGLSLDVVSNKPYFIERKLPEATVTKDVYIPARSRQMCKIKIPKECIKKNVKDSLQVLQVNIPTCKQIFEDELLLNASDDGYTNVYLTNVSQTAQRIKKGTSVGEIEEIRESKLHPFSVESTTPFVNLDEVKKLPIPKLTPERKRRILKLARLNHLPAHLKDKYAELLLKNHACISLEEFDLGRCTKGAHSIPTKADHPPTYQKQFPLPIEHEKEIRRQVLEWLKIGIIRPCESEYNSSLFLVEKKAPPAKVGELGLRPKAYRIVQDLRALNRDTLPSNVRLPEIHECLDRIADKKPTVFSALDLRSGYFQLPIQKESQEKTAFTCLSLGQQFCFKVTSQGLTSAPASFARTMQRIFNRQIARNDLEVYLDDVLAYSKDHNEMLKTLDEAMKNLIESGMKINIEKCQFGIEKLTYLGFEISKDGYKPDPVKSEGITKVNEPSNLKGVRSFMGMANFYRLLIPKFAQLTKPLTRLTCKGAWAGGEMPKSAKEAFKKCQEIFTNRPFLHYPDFNLKFHLFVDASLGDLDEAKEGGLAGCLVQYPDNDTTKKCRPIGFCSRGLQKHEKNYSAHLIETAGIIFSIEFFEKYLRTKFVVHTDHKPITTVKEGKTHKRTLERFKEILSSYDFDLVYTPGDKIPSDFMSRHIKSEDFKPNVAGLTINCLELDSLLEKPEKETKKFENQTSQVRACSACEVEKCKEPSGASIATQAIHNEKKERLVTSRSQKGVGKSAKIYWERAQEAAVHAIGIDLKTKLHSAEGKNSTNNEELSAQCWARAQEEAIKALRAEESAVQSRPEEPFKNHEGKLHVKNESAQPTSADSVEVAVGAVDKKAGVRKIEVQVAHPKFSRPTLHVQLADAAKKIKELKKSLSIFGVKGTIQSFNLFETKLDKNPKLLKMQQGIDPFVQAMLHFVKTKNLPKDRYRNIIKRWGPYCFQKNGVTMVQFSKPGFPTRELVIAPAERISDIIAQAHGSLLGGHDGVDKTVQRILTNYWFPGVHSETDFFIENCPICQKNKKKEKTSNTFLQPLKQADQPFERIHMDLFGPLRTEQGKSYIQVMVDSFSKFAIFQVIPNKEAETIAKCFFDNWISVLGSPLSIVSDRGSEFKTETLQKVCDILQIDKKVITTKHPQANSQVEILNKKIAKYLKSMTTEGVLEWPKMVKACQYAYNLSVHKALKNSPYSILFGVDANTPLNQKGFVTQPIYGDKYQHSLANRLKLARKLAKANNMSFRDDYTKRFNKNVKPHQFTEGMLVYLHRPEQLKINPKLQSPWFGPFVILQMINKANCLIQELSNKKTKFVNVNRLRPYNQSIKQWQNFKLTLNKEKPSAAAPMQEKSDEKISEADDAIAHAPAYAEFDIENDVVILNPDVQPIPKMSIKEEIVEQAESVTEDPAAASFSEDPDLNLSHDPTASSTVTPPTPTGTKPKSGRRKRESIFDTIMDSMSNPAKPLTRGSAAQQGIQIKSIREQQDEFQEKLDKAKLEKAKLEKAKLEKPKPKKPKKSTK